MINLRYAIFHHSSASSANLQIVDYIKYLILLARSCKMHDKTKIFRKHIFCANCGSVEGLFDFNVLWYKFEREL